MLLTSAESFPEILCKLDGSRERCIDLRAIILSTSGKKLVVSIYSRFDLSKIDILFAFSYENFGTD